MQRTAKECEIRWLGERHPRFNHAQWMQSEVDRLKQLVGFAEEGQVDWVEIARKLGVRVIWFQLLLYTVLTDITDWTHPR